MYLTVYKKAAPLAWGQMPKKYTGDKFTLKLKRGEFKPLDEGQALSIKDAEQLETWSQGKELPANKAERYHSFRIPKRSGGMRDIKEPVGLTKSVQRNICYTMKTNLKILPHDCCHGFVKHRRCLSAMEVHRENQSNWFLKLDIHNFFPSITKEHILEMFSWLPQMETIPDSVKEYLADTLTDETGRLTQGCVSSPYIANLVLLDFDYKFSNWCRKNRLTYTRYADDMCISSRVKFDKRKVAEKVSSLLPEGIKINNEKTKMTSIAQENVFLGIHYNQDKNLTVGHETKHLMKVIAHKAELGQLPADEHRTWKGRLSYYTSIEPTYFSNSRFDSIRNL